MARTVFSRKRGSAVVEGAGRIDAMGVETGLQTTIGTSAVKSVLEPSTLEESEELKALNSVTSIGTPKRCSHEDWICTTSSSWDGDVPYLVLWHEYLPSDGYKHENILNFDYTAALGLSIPARAESFTLLVRRERVF